MSTGDDLDALLAEQVEYYRARAPEYAETAIPELPVGELASARDAMIAALERFRPAGDVLELACASRPSGRSSIGASSQTDALRSSMTLTEPPTS
jgi:hypothetical protein